MKAFVLALLLVPGIVAVAAEPNIFSVPPGALARAKVKVVAKEKSVQPAFDQLLNDADKALKQKPLSVMEKPKTWPGVDKHDYFSTAPYFWPNPETKDGLPYIRKDGQRNPESRNEHSDSSRMGRITGAANTLALAHYFTGKDAYAEHAAKLLRVWFLDPETRMNPNFDHAQAVPGVNTGRGIGMIESLALMPACDAATLLRGSKSWSKTDDEAFTKWMRTFLEWAQTSKNGRDEAAASNNHGTYYDVQVTHFALFVGQTNLARSIVEEAKRIAAQVEPDGTQPRELSREDSFAYSQFNVRAMFQLALLGEYVGVDLWRYESPKGASIRKALDYLVPFAEDPTKPWPHEHSKKTNRSLSWLPRRACFVYHTERYCKLVEKDSAAQRDALFFPLE
jgi:hypothetical protein